MCALTHITGDCKIEKIQVSPEVKRYVETLGFLPGTKIHVVSSNKTGCVLEIRGSRLAIGVELADQIMVSSAQNDPGNLATAPI